MQQSKAKAKGKGKPNRMDNWTRRGQPETATLAASARCIASIKNVRNGRQRRERARERGGREGKRGKPVATVRLLFVPLSVARVALG